MKERSLENILRYSIISGIFLLPLSIFIVSNSLFFPYITRKNFYLRIIVEIIFALWAILAMLNAKYRPKMSWLVGVVIVFVALIAISDATGVNPEKSFWSNLERMEGLISLLHFLAYFVVLVSVFAKEKLWDWFWNTIVGISIIQGFIVLAEIAGLATISLAGDRADGTFGNPIYMAGFMLVVFFVTLWLLYRRLSVEKTSSTVWLVAMYISALILQVVGIFASGTRGSILGLIGGLVLISILVSTFGRKHPRLRKASAGALLVVVILGGLFFVARDTSFVQETQSLKRIADISITEGSGASRIKLWNIALEGFLEKPILGWGQGNFIEVFSQHYRSDMYDQEPWFDRAHNIVLNWLVVGGILGLLAYLSLWILTLFYFWHPRSEMSIPEKSILTGLLAAYFFHNLFVFDNVVSYMLFFSILGYAHHRRVDVERQDRWNKILGFFGFGRDEPRSMSFGTGTASVASGILVILLCLLIWQVNLRPMNTASSLVKAASVGRQDPSKALAFFKEATDNSTLGKTEARAQLTLAAAGLASQNLDAETKARYFDESERVMKLAIQDNPDSVRQRLIYALLLNAYGQYEKAIEVAEEALKISPKYQRLYEQLGSAYMGLGEYQRAFEVYEDAWRVDEQFYSLRTGSVQALMAMDRFDEAAEIIERGGKDIKIGDKGVILSGNDISQFIVRGYDDVAKTLLEALAGASQDNPQGLVSAAAGFLQIGERERSIDLIERAMEIEPRFEAQGKRLIEDIRAGRNPLE